MKVDVILESDRKFFQKVRLTDRMDKKGLNVCQFIAKGINIKFHCFKNTSYCFCECVLSDSQERKFEITFIGHPGSNINVWAYAAPLSSVHVCKVRGKASIQ